MDDSVELTGRESPAEWRGVAGRGKTQGGVGSKTLRCMGNGITQRGRPGEVERGEMLGGVGVMPTGAEGVNEKGEGARQQWSWAGRAFHGFELILGVEEIAVPPTGSPLMFAHIYTHMH